MKNAPFYFEIKDIMTQFVSAFNDIIISRHDKNKNVRSRVHVRYVYAPKQRVVHDLTNKARHITLPVVAVNITGISRDVDRVFNKIEGSYHLINEANRLDRGLSDHVLQPVPIDISVNMSILARYQTDVEQIVSNFVPYNDPYIVLSWKLPEQFTSTEQEIRSEVLWSGDLALTYPETLSSTEPYRLSCDTQFTIKTWLFKRETSPVSNIYKITANYKSIEDSPFMDPDYDEIERSYIDTVGPPLTAAPSVTHTDNQHGNITNIFGYNFDSTLGIYVSGHDTNSSHESVNVKPFDTDNLNEEYPAFTAVPLKYEIINNNYMIMDTKDVKYDINDVLILRNEGGYIQLNVSDI